MAISDVICAGVCYYTTAICTDGAMMDVGPVCNGLLYTLCNWLGIRY